MSYQIVRYENMQPVDQNLLSTDIAVNARQRNYYIITGISLVVAGGVLVFVNIVMSGIVSHVIQLFNLKNMVIYVFVIVTLITVMSILIIRYLLWGKIEKPLVNFAARRELMHFYLGSKEYYSQRARYLYERRLRGFTTPQLKTTFQKFCYYIGWYPVGDIFHFTDTYAQQHLHQQSNKKTLVLDLDETLIASVMKERARNDETFDEEISIQSNDKYIRFYVYYRPFLDNFLKVVKKWYNIVIYTASKRSYAEPIVKRMNQKFNNCIKRLYCKESLVTQNDGSATKDLTKVLEDLTKVVFIDNNIHNFILQPNNSILIRSWCNDNNEDRELDNLIQLLEALSLVDDITSVLKLDQ